MTAVLYVFGGLPGTGKTTLSKRLARDLGAAYLRVDTIEHALREEWETREVGPEGYAVAFRLAEEQLSLGLNVVADSVNSLAVTRDAWRSVAKEARVPIREVEVRCSDREEHRRRVETRRTTVDGLGSRPWGRVCARHFDPWKDALTLDTAGRSVEESTRALRALLRL